ncbi:MAG: PD-(D/E)XK nuclease-like domain-containing protein [Pirellulaceae bacterium]
MTTLNQSDFLIREPAEVYHTKARDYLSSHQLADFRKCPLLYYQKQLGIVPDEDRPAYVIGRAVHTLALEGEEEFDRQFAVGGPINPKTNAPFGAGTKAFAEWCSTHGKSVLTDAQYSLVCQMSAGVRAHEQAASLLAFGVAEGVVRTNYCGQPSQIRMDWFEPQQGIVDLKTCDDLTWFEADARRYGYTHQMAFYRAVLAEVLGIQMPVHFIAIEKKSPYRCGVWKVQSEALDAAQRENEAAIRRLQRCIEADVWPTGYEDIRIYDSF